MIFLAFLAGWFVAAWLGWWWRGRDLAENPHRPLTRSAMAREGLTPCAYCNGRGQVECIVCGGPGCYRDITHSPERGDVP